VDIITTVSESRVQRQMVNSLIATELFSDGGDGQRDYLPSTVATIGVLGVPGVGSV